MKKPPFLKSNFIKILTLKLDQFLGVRSQKRDKYGRLLAYVFLKDGTFLNAEIVKQGYGKASTYPPNVKYAEKFRKLQSQARENNRGLWAPHGEPSKEVVSSHAKTENDAVYITRTAKKYHRGNCRYLSKSKIPISLKDALTLMGLAAFAIHQL